MHVYRYYLREFVRVFEVLGIGRDEVFGGDVSHGNSAGLELSHAIIIFGWVFMCLRRGQREFGVGAGVWLVVVPGG